jgi:protoporphyrin/coproporphyrin ferrochelatase
MNTHASTAVVLMNLGTPDAPTPAALRRYLRAFLNDARVIDLPNPFRWLLINLIIAPFRAHSSAKKYAHVWTEQGSPLMVHSKALHQAVAAQLPETPVFLAMSYGSPSFEEAVGQVAAAKATRVVLLPLFPQYSSAAWGGAVEAFSKALLKRNVVPALSVVPPFFADPAFLKAQADNLSQTMSTLQPDLVLFSYHGLPVRQIRKGCGSSVCLQTEAATCCDALTPDNAMCYRAQCLATSRALSRRLNLTAHETVFQSRIRGDTWIGPHLEERLAELAKAGTKRVAVVCPSFVSDCLETLEEVGLRAKEVFVEAGGEALELVPCVNTADSFVEGMVSLLKGEL